MIEKDITLYELSSRTGLSYSNLSKIVNQRQKPQIDSLYLIAEALNVHVSKLEESKHYDYVDMKNKRTV